LHNGVRNNGAGVLASTVRRDKSLRSRVPKVKVELIGFVCGVQGRGCGYRSDRQERHDHFDAGGKDDGYPISPRNPSGFQLCRQFGHLAPQGFIGDDGTIGTMIAGWLGLPPAIRSSSVSGIFGMVIQAVSTDLFVWGKCMDVNSIAYRDIINR